ACPAPCRRAKGRRRRAFFINALDAGSGSSRGTRRASSLAIISWQRTRHRLRGAAPPGSLMNCQARAALRGCGYRSVSQAGPGSAGAYARQMKSNRRSFLSDALFCREDANAARIGRHCMIVKLHRTGHFNPSETQSDAFSCRSLPSDNNMSHRSLFRATKSRQIVQLLAEIPIAANSLPALQRNKHQLKYRKHRVRPELGHKTYKGKYLFPWVMAKAFRLPKPVSYRHPSGAVIWVTLTDDVVHALTRQIRRHDAVENSQIFVAPLLMRHIMPLIMQDDELIVSIPEWDGPMHDYTFSMQPNDIALKPIRARCFDF